MSRCLSLAAVVALLALAGCNPPTPDNSAEVKLKIYTWWIEGGEKQALDALEKANREKHPNVSLERIEAGSGEEASELLNAVLYTKIRPPDTFQTNGGSKLLSRVVGRDDQGVVTSTDQLQPLATDLSARIDQRVWKFVQPMITYNDAKYGVPLNLHRINNLYYSVPKLAAAKDANLFQVDELGRPKLPTDINGFVALAMALCEARGGPSIGIGWDDTFTVETFVFENLMPSVAIAASDLEGTNPLVRFNAQDRVEFYEEFWKGNKHPAKEPSRTVIDRTLRIAQDLWRCVKTVDGSKDPPAPYSWSDSLNALLNEPDSVVFVAMGDWATGYLQSQEKDPETHEKYQLGPDFGFVPFPGTESLFVYTTDTLPLTFVASHPDETQAFLETALEDAAQIAFNLKKGSIPAVKLQNPLKSGLQPHQLALMALLRDTESDDSLHKSAAISGLLTPGIGETFFRDALRRALVAEDKVNGRDLMQHALDNNYWLLSRWTDTLEQGQQGK